MAQLIVKKEQIAKDRKKKKMSIFYLFSLVGQWALFTYRSFIPSETINWRHAPQKENEGQKMKNMKNLKVQIRSAQDVGKVWINRKKSSWPHLGPSETIFSMDRKNAKHVKMLLFSLVGQWALFTRFRPLLLSTRGGAIGICEFFQCVCTCRGASEKSDRELGELEDPNPKSQ